MKRTLTLLSLLLLLPVAAMAQSTLRVQSLYGPVEMRPAASGQFGPMLATARTVQLGDEIRTGPGGTVMLEVPDGSYMVVSENTTLTVQDFWSPSIKNLAHLAMGKVRFYIMRIGGKPNPYRVQTPTALIAVRGTTFEINVDAAAITEVRCLEGRVTVESAGLPDREVILDEGRKTLVRPGEYPAMPVPLAADLAAARIIRMVRKDADEPARVAKKDGPEVLAVRDNDRHNRISDPLAGPASRINSDVKRAKGTLSWPENQ